MAGLVIKPRARLFHGHDWVYASDVLKAFGEPQPGDVVSLKDGKDHLLGSAIYNPVSQIVARRYSRRRQDLDQDFFRRRVAQALEYRNRRGVNPRLSRLVWSESDGLPGVIVDRYNDHLVLQTLTRAMDQRKSLLVDVLVELLSPAAIVERNDAPVRKAEGMEAVTGFLHGNAREDLLIGVDGLQFAVNLLRGHKTGFYLDQIANCAQVAHLAPSRRVLDCFSNQGAFALACAKGGASSVTAVEISADAVAAARANGTRNGLTQIEWREDNVFDVLAAEERQNAQYDLIVLDPPSFTKSKSQIGDAMRGYKELHLRALKLLAPDGLLATFCCSHHVSAGEFGQMIVDASVDAKRAVRQIARFAQGADHPIIPTLPETEYLKGYLLEAMPGR